MIHNEVKKVMMLYSSKLNEMFPNQILGVYLYGSTVIGAFHSESSDIDFVTVFSREVTDKEVRKLSYLHKKLRTENPLIKSLNVSTYSWMSKINYIYIDLSRFLTVQSVRGKGSYENCRLSACS